MENREIEAFGQRIGLPGLALNESDLAALEVDGLGTMTLEVLDPLEAASAAERDERLLLTLALLPQGDAPARFERALERFGWRRAPQYAVRTALVQDRLVLAIEFPPEAIDAANLENGLRFLLEAAETLRRE